jgi:hypothetical protein
MCWRHFPQRDFLPENAQMLKVVPIIQIPPSPARLLKCSMTKKMDGSSRLLPHPWSTNTWQEAPCLRACCLSKPEKLFSSAPASSASSEFGTSRQWSGINKNIGLSLPPGHQHRYVQVDVQGTSTYEPKPCQGAARDLQPVRSYPIEAIQIILEDHLST